MTYHIAKAKPPKSRFQGARAERRKWFLEYPDHDRIRQLCDLSRVANWALDAFEGCACEEKYLCLRSGGH